MSFIDKFVNIVKHISFMSYSIILVNRRLEKKVVTMFLYCFFDKNIYIIQPKLFHMEWNDEKVCWPQKTICDVKQSPNVSYQTFFDFLQKMRFNCSQSIDDVFDLINILIAIYLDNGIIFSKHNSQLKHLEKKLDYTFWMTELNKVCW